MQTNDFTSWALLNSQDELLCEYDGIVEATFSSSSQVLSEPIEGGELAAYNKTKSPDQVSVQLVVGPDQAKQLRVIADLSVYLNGVGTKYLCKLVSPNSVVENLALESVGRTHSVKSGASLLLVDLDFRTVNVVNVTKGKVKQWKGKRATSSAPVDKGKQQSAAKKLANSLL
ncbi:MAG: hypothetical protein SOR95_08435 [Sutterella sp.]|nr:hypothetical protein [Sutterella sp.]